MAHNLLEILNKCERRLSKKAKRSDLEFQIEGQDYFENCETQQGDEWQRLFIAIIQLYIESLSTKSSVLSFQLKPDTQQMSTVLTDFDTHLSENENVEKLKQNIQLIDEAECNLTSKTLEVTFNLHQLPSIQAHARKQILCADDNPDNRQIMQLLLEKMGHSVSTAENGKLALEATLSQEFDLIFLDIQMPVMDGLEALELIRSTACESPIVAFTAQVLDHEVSELLEHGFDAWLAKPIDRQKLDAILQTYLHCDTNSQNIEFDPAVLKEMQQTYQASLHQYLIDIEEATQQQDHLQMARLAHALKGSGGNFGFDDITQIAGQVEQACKADSSIWPSEPISNLVNLLNLYKN